MKSFWVDVNVWLALSSGRHAHYQAAHQWFDTVGPAQAAFCRLVQLAYLRLLTNPRVMGPDVLSPREAWRAYDELCGDVRVTFVGEAAGAATAFRRLSPRLAGSPGNWTDAWLAALAEAHELTIVSFDRGFQRLPGVDARLLSSRV